MLLSPVRLKLFLIAEAGLYAAFLTIDLLGGQSAPFKYAAIVLCLLAALAAARADRGRKTDARLVAAILLLTAAADVFLLLLDRYYLAGVLLFCAVQTQYALRLHRLCRQRRWLFLRAAALAAAWGAVWAAGAADALTVASAYSFSQLTLNAILAVCLWRTHADAPPALTRLALGLPLFWACDLCVGLSNLSGYFPVSGADGWLRAASFGMWLFYLPAQVLLALSAMPDSGRKGERNETIQ